MKRAGRLDTRVSFETETEVSTGGGGVRREWSVQFSRQADPVYPNLSARLERESSGALTNAQRVSLLIRSDESTRLIDHTWRCSFHGKVWNVRGVTPIGRNDRISLIVESGVAV